MSLVVEEAYPDGVPQTTVPGWAPTGATWHWSAGGAGRAGWDGTVRHLITTRWTVNASYHAGFWHEHRAGGACRTVIQWIVPTSKAAHSIAPSQVFQLNPNKDRATQDARFAEVRRILAARAWDPNAACVAIAYAGMPLGLEKDLACPVFRADVQELATAVIEETSVLDRPHFGHGWIQPISRYEMDVATDFIGLLYAAPGTPEETMPTDFRAAKHQDHKIVTVELGATIYRYHEGTEAHGQLTERTEFDFLGLTLAERHLVRRTDRVGDAVGWIGQEAIVPPAVIPYRRYTLDGDCSDEIATAEAAVTAHVNQEWRQWLATAPAGQGDPS